MSEVSIVIPNYNGIAYLKDCLDSLRMQTLKNIEVLLVDNGSGDGSTEFVQAHYPEVKILKLRENYGFCRAVNEGIRAAASPYVILLNNDTRADIHFAEELLKGIRKRPRCFSCASKMVKMHEPGKIDDAGDYYCALGWAFALGKDCPEKEYDTERKIFASCAGAAIYRRNLFEEIGYFDERHFAYLEDMDVGYRARIHGYENWYLPDALVYHVGSGTSGSRYNEFKIRYSSRNNVYMLYKNMPLLQILLNLPFLAVGFLVKQVFFASKGYGMEYARGIWAGMRMAAKGEKVRFQRGNLINYCKIQLELWANILKKVKKS